MFNYFNTYNKKKPMLSEEKCRTNIRKARKSLAEIKTAIAEADDPSVLKLLRECRDLLVDIIEVIEDRVSAVKDLDVARSQWNQYQMNESIKRIDLCDFELGKLRHRVDALERKCKLIF